MGVYNMKHIILTLALAAALPALGCYKSDGTGGQGGIAPQDPVNPFFAAGAGSMIPNYGPIAGGNTVTVLLPREFTPDAAGLEVRFDGIAATGLTFDPEQSWFLTCVVPPSPSGSWQRAEVELSNGGGDAYLLEKPYTYINPLAEVNYASREAMDLADVDQLVPTDYDGDGDTDLVGRRGNREELVFLLNDGTGGFTIELVRRLAKVNGKTPFCDGLIAARIDGDRLEDLVVFGEHGFWLMLNTGVPGPTRYELVPSLDFRQGISACLSDLNDDGYRDLVMGGLDAIRIFGFAPELGRFHDYPALQIDTELANKAVAAVDLNRDGLEDLVSVMDNRITWYLRRQTPGLGENPFEAPRVLSIDPVSAAHGIRRLVAEDLNKDGIPDLAFTAADVVPFEGGALGVALADRKGGLLDAAYYPVPGVGRGTAGAFDLTTVDHDHDGDPDLAVTAAGRNSVILFENDGPGTFTGSQRYGVGEDPVSIARFATDAAGRSMDLVVAERGAGTVSFLRSCHRPGLLGEDLRFACSVDIPLDIEPDRIEVLDLDGNDLPDVVAAEYKSDSITILKADPEQGLVPSGKVMLSGGSFENFRLIHANALEDRDPDLAVISSNGVAKPGFLHILENDGLGGFYTGQVLPTGFMPSDVAVEDLDNDGYHDVLVSFEYSDSVAIYRGSETGIFAFAGERSPITGPRDLEIADLDGDFDGDALVVSPDEYSLYVLKTDAVDVLNLLPGSKIYAGVRPTDVSVGDFNFDGFKDAVINAEGDAVGYILLNDGFGTLSFSYSLPLAEPAVTVSALDLDFDYDADLLTPSASGRVEVMMNQSFSFIS